MTGSVYQKTSLPAKLDLTKYNTREQLKAEQDPKKANRGGTGRETAAATSQQDCNDVMKKDLRDWLVKHDINGPPPNAVAEQKAMWAWIRDFHQEYSDDWFSRNMPRLHEQFKPVFMSEMKAMKAAVAKTAPQTTSAVDMLDFDGPPVTNASTSSTSKPAVGGTDLLDMSEPTPAPVTSAPVTTQATSQNLLEPSVTPSAPPTNVTNLSDSLLSLDLGISTPVPSPALVTAPLAPMPASNDLLAGVNGLDMGLNTSNPQPTQQSAPLSSFSDLGLIDFSTPSLAPTTQVNVSSSSGYSASFPPVAQIESNLLSQVPPQSSPKEPPPTTDSSKELNLLDLL